MAQQAQITTNIAANGTEFDILQGQTLRFIRTRGVVQIGIVSDGAAMGDVVANVTIGGRAVAQNFAVGVESVAGGGVQEDRDIKIKAPVQPGDEILINLSNTTVGALNAFTYVNVPFQG